MATLNDFQKRWVLEQSGYDPDKYQLNDDGSIVPKVKEQPVVSDNSFQTSLEVRPAPETNGYGVKGTFAGSAVEAVPSTFAGGLAFARAQRALTASRLATKLPGPAWAKPLYGIGAGTIAAAGAGGATGYLTQLAEKPFIKAALDAASTIQQDPSDIMSNPVVKLGQQLIKLKQGQAEHPTAAFAGQLAATPASGMGFAPVRLAKALQHGLPALVGKSIPAAELPNVLNVGIGAALQPAIYGGKVALTDEEFSLPHLLAETGVGAAFSRPNRLGLKFGFEDIPGVKPSLPGLEQTVPFSAETVEAGPKRPTPAEVSKLIAVGGAPGERGRRVRLRIDPETGELVIDNISTKLTPQGVEQLAKVQENPIKGLRRPDETVEADIARMEGEGGVQAKPPQTTRTFNLPEFAKGSDIPQERALTLFEPGRFRQAPPQKGIRFSEEGKFKPEDETPTTEFERKMIDLYQKLGRKADLPVWFDMFKKWGASMRNVKLQEDGSIVDDKGNPIAGQAVMKQGLEEVTAKINPNKVTDETIPHEFFHAFYHFLKQSARKVDIDIIRNLENTVKKDADYLRWREERAAQKLDTSVDEFITTEQGAEFIRRNLNLEGETPFKTWYKDLAAHLKTRFTKDATLNDYRRLMQYRFQNDPAFSKYFKTGDLHLTGAAAHTTSAQEEGKFEDVGAKFLGEQEGYGPIPSRKLYNLTKDILDAEGNIIKAKGSTVVEDTLKKYNVKYSEEGKFKKLSPREQLAILGQPAEGKVLEKPRPEDLVERKAFNTQTTKRAAEILDDAANDLVHFSEGKLTKAEAVESIFILSRGGPARDDFEQRFSGLEFDDFLRKVDKFGNISRNVATARALVNRIRSQESAGITRRQSEEGKFKISDKEFDASLNTWEDVAKQIGQAALKYNIKLADTYIGLPGDPATNVGKKLLDKLANNDPVADKFMDILMQKGFINVAGSNDLLKRGISAMNTLREVNNLPRLERKFSEEGKFYDPDFEQTTDEEFAAQAEAELGKAPASKADLESLAAKFPEKKTLLDPKNDEVVSILQQAVKGTDDASLSLEDVEEIKQALINQVDWSKSSRIKSALEAMDSSDPTHWADLQRFYNADYFTESPKVKATKIETPKVEATKVTTPKQVVEPTTPRETKEPSASATGGKALKSWEVPSKPVDPLLEELKNRQPNAPEKEKAKLARSEEMWDRIYDSQTTTQGQKILDILRESYHRQLEFAKETKDINAIYDAKNRMQEIRMQASILHKLYPSLEKDPFLKFSEEGKFGEFKRLTTDDLAKERRLNEEVRDWLINGGKMPEAPKVIYRGVPKGAIQDFPPGYKHMQHASPWISVAEKGGLISGYDHDVYRYPVGAEQIYYRGGALMGDPLESTAIDSIRGIGWNDALAKTKKIFDRNVQRQINSYDYDIPADVVNRIRRNAANDAINHLIRGTFETDVLNKYGKFTSGIPLDRRTAKRITPGLRTNDEIAEFEAKHKDTFYSEEGKFTPLEKELTSMEDDLVYNMNKDQSGGLTSLEAAELKKTDRQLAEFDALKDPDTLVKNQPLGRFNPVRSEITKIEELPHKNAPLVAKAFSNFDEQFRKYKGKFTNAAVDALDKYLDWTNPKELFTQNNKDFDTVVDYLFDMQDGGKSDIKLTAKQLEIEREVRKNLQETVAEKNTFKGLRHSVADPNYIPFIPSRDVLNTILNKSGTPEAKALMADWYKYYAAKGKSKPEADKALDIFRGGYDKQQVNLAQQFGPVDRAAGLGIPRSWREHNLMDIMTRFNNRYARRLAYHKTIESQEDVINALHDREEGLAVAEPVKTVAEDIAGVTEQEEAKRNAIAGMVRAMMLGPLTGAKDFASNLTLGWQHQDLQQVIPALWDSWSNMKRNITDSFKEGVNRHNISTLEFGEGALTDAIKTVRRLRDITSTVSGRNHLERWARATAFGQGKFLAMDNLWRAHKGKLTGQGKRFLDDFGPENWQQYRDKGEFPPDVLDTMAARFVESVQGTYGYRGLPRLTQRGSLAPVLSLARWNVEKFNNFVKYNVNPALKGDIKPLLMSTLGMLVGGTAVNELVEQVTGRKQKTPTVKEISTLAEEGKGVAAPVAYKLAALSSLSGYAGIMGDVIRSALDYSYGKTMPQMYDNPLLIGAKTIAQNSFDVLEAFQKGDLKAGADYLSQMLEDLFQAYRLAMPYISAETREDIERANKLRDQKVFKITHGYPVGSPFRDRPNPFIDKDIKEFKRTMDIGKAAKMMPDLIQSAIDDSEGNYDKLKSNLLKIKQNSYQTMPNPDRSPVTFSEYYRFLVKTQGKEEADRRLQDYMKANAINRAKASFIP